MTSSNPPKPRKTVKIDAVEVAKLAARSVPCPDCLELLPQIEALRANLKDERLVRIRLEGALTSAFERANAMQAQLDELRALLREHSP